MYGKVKDPDWITVSSKELVRYSETTVTVKVRDFELPVLSMIVSFTVLLPLERYGPTSTVTSPCATFRAALAVSFTYTVMVPSPVGMLSSSEDQETFRLQEPPSEIVVLVQPVVLFIVMTESVLLPPPPPPMPENGPREPEPSVTRYRELSCT